MFQCSDFILCVCRGVGGDIHVQSFEGDGPYTAMYVTVLSLHFNLQIQTFDRSTPCTAL